MHNDHRRNRKQSRGRKATDARKRPALEAEELSGLSAVEPFTSQEGADDEQGPDAFVLTALTPLTRRVEELEKQLEPLKQQHVDVSEF